MMKFTLPVSEYVNYAVKLVAPGLAALVLVQPAVLVQAAALDWSAFQELVGDAACQ
jgi:hypothetical protein